QPVEGLLDLNVLPKRYQPSRPSFLTISAWLLFLVLLGLLVPSTTQFQEASSSLAAQRIRLELAQEQLAQDRSSPEELETLRADIEATWRRAEELQVSLASLNIQTVQWGPRLAEAVAAAPAGIRFESVQEDSDLITIVGL
ncbi:MAG: hypothetical protein GWN58_67530, partial [Anaerolineae bacterium]|nr:hypothetical protein [Anaerolineae bacterium]